MINLLTACVVLVCTLFLFEVPAADVSFSQPPAVVKAGDIFKISFALSAPSDVEVSIVNAKGDVVRSLAAGVLGKNAPAPFKPDSLAQSVEWDGKDDDGKLADGGPFKARVRLGLKLSLDSYLFDSPGTMGGVDSLAVGPTGELFVACGSGGLYVWSGTLTRVYDRQGKYLRTIDPYPSNLPVEKLKGVGAFQSEGRLFPIYHDVQAMRTVPGVETYGHEMFVTSSGKLCKLVLGWGGYCVRTIGIDGSTPDASVLGQPMAPGVRPSENDRRNWICPSSDEKYVYFSGVTARDSDKHFRQHAIYRTPLDGSAEGKVFLGAPLESGNDDKHFKDPMGVATDGKGLLYVADNGNNRIQIFKESDGSLVGSIPCAAPATVHVHPKTGAIYVVSAPGFNMALVKLSGRTDSKEVARIALPKAPGERFAVLAMDSTSEPPAFWLGGYRVPTMHLEDHGSSLVETPVSWPKGGIDAGIAEDLWVDRNREELYYKPWVEQFWRMDIKTGKVDKLPYPGGADSYATQLAMSPDGQLFYTWNHMSSPGMAAGLRKWDRNFKPVNFEALGSNNLNLQNPMNFGCRGLAVAPDGNIWMIPCGPGSAYTICTEMQVYKPDGTKKGTVLWRLSEGATGPKFDHQGNFYLVECIKAQGKAMPDFFGDKLPPLSDKTHRHARPPSAPTGSTAWIYSTILKFPSTGGIVWFNNFKMFGGKSGWNAEVPADILNLPRVKYSELHGDDQKMIDIDVQGATMSYYGVSPFTDKAGNNHCNCQSSRFDVDDFGRSFFPDAGRFRVGVIDTNGNEISFAGSYGNRDCGGKGSMIPDPEIAFAYPYTVACSRTHVFVGDLLNHRIVKLKRVYAAEGICDAK
jgi:sugar lactone lactonase YvrE